MVDHSKDPYPWSAKAMVTSLRAFLRFAHATVRMAIPLTGAVPAVSPRVRVSCWKCDSPYSYVLTTTRAGYPVAS